MAKTEKDEMFNSEEVEVNNNSKFDFEETVDKTEDFVMKNKKIIAYIVGAIIIVVMGIFLFLKVYIPGKETEAQNQMFVAEKYFEKEDFNKALNGDGNYPGFLKIIDDYSFTKSSNIAKYYAGICNLKLGKFEQAIPLLEGFDSDDMIVAPMAIGAIGDAYMELGKTEEGIKYYLKAADKNENNFSSPMFLLKAAFAYEDLNKYKEALDTYELIRTKHFRSQEGREVEKYIARVKALMENK